VIDRVQALVRKERLKRDREVQVLEDVVCVVFLAHYLADFAAKHESDKVVEILRKTWAKMSPLGRRAALALPFDGALAALLAAALADEAVADEAVSDEATSPGATQPV
jgi:hypothetical protein